MSHTTTVGFGGFPLVLVLFVLLVIIGGVVVSDY